MKEKIKSIKLDVTVSALLSVVIGILFIVRAEDVITIFARLIAVIFIVSGLVLLIPRLVEENKSYLSIIVALIVSLIGVWMFISPQLVASAIPIAIGVILVVHGIQDLTLAVEGKKNHANNWWSIPLVAILNIALGVLCICEAFGIVKLGLMLIGVMLVFDGLSDMFIVVKVNKAGKEVVDSKLTKEENIDDYDDFV